MSILVMMIPIALIFAGAFVGAFVWATKSGQFDDVETPAHRMLNDEDKTQT